MPPPLETVRSTVDQMLREHLPQGWGYRIKLHHRANDQPASEIDAHDYCWHIWRPEHLGDSLTYYELQMVGNSGAEFVLTYDNSDVGAVPDPAKAMVFNRWTARGAFKLIVDGGSGYGPNRYG